MNRKLLALIVVAILGAAADLVPAPWVQTGDAVDEYFGTKVADPYRALENESLPQTQAFIAAQNARTRAFLDTPAREQFKQRLTALYDYPRQTPPQRKGKFAFFSTNTGLQNQSILRVTEKIGDEGRVLIDPNLLSEDGTVSLDFNEFTKDGTLVAYGLARSGSDHSDIHVKDVVTGKDLPDVIPPARIYSVAWKYDKTGFYYGKFPKTVETGRDEQAYNFQIFFHKLGAPVEQDRLIYERPEDKEMEFELSITDQGAYETLSLTHGTRPENRLYVRPANSDAPWTKLIDVEEFQYHVIDNDGSTLYVRTTDGAPRSRVIAIDVNNPTKQNWKELIPQTGDVIDSINLVGDKFIVAYMHDAQNLLKIHNKDGSIAREVALPTVGTVTGITSQRNDSDFFYTFMSYSYPRTVCRYDLKNNENQTIFAPPVKFNPADYETRQLFATSKDGTRVPVFITHKKGIKLDGNNPALLSGYGGFEISTTPAFSATRVTWMERGGVFAEACMRGGGEYGDAWHKAGMFEKKQNVFDDFHAAAELLVKEEYTSSKKLAIQGGSNGGLLVAATMLQRPDLYGAVICMVPLTDMLRFHKLGIGRFWTVEYGSAEANAEQFKTLYAYSPVHNVKADQTYPPILITTSEGDNRVVPGHSYKFAATLQANSSSSNTILLRVEPKAGHGGGMPTSKVIDEWADVFAFLSRVFGMN